VVTTSDTTTVTPGKRRNRSDVRFFPPPLPAGPQGWSRRTAGSLVVSLYLAASVLLHHTEISAGLASSIKGRGDTFLNVYFIGWVPHALSHLQNPLFAPGLNAPEGLNLMVNTSQPALGFLMWPVTALSGPVLSFNLLLLLAFPLTALAAYVVARHLVAWRPAAFIAGAVVGFSVYETATGPHIQLSFAALVPLFFLLGLWVLRGAWPPLKAGVALATLVVVQFFISTEVMATTLIALGLTTLVTVALYPQARQRTADALRTAVIGGAISLAVLAYPLWFLLRGPSSIRGPVQLVAQAYRSDLLALLIPPRTVALAPEFLTRISDHFSTVQHENVAYLGAPLVVVFAATLLWSKRGRPTLALGASAIGTFILGLGGALAVTGAPPIGPRAQAVGGLWLPEALLAQFPMAKNIIPSRFALYTALLVGLVVALGFERLRRRLDGSPGRAVVPIGVMALCALALVPAGSPSSPRVRTSSMPAYFSSPAFTSHPEGGLLVLCPFPNGRNPLGILWQAQSGYRFRMPSGHAKAPEGPDHHVAYGPLVEYSVSTPVSTTFTAISRGIPLERTPNLRRQVLDELGAWKTTAVVVTKSELPRRRQGMQDLRWLLGTPTSRVGSTVTYDAPGRR